MCGLILNLKYLTKAQGQCHEVSVDVTEEENPTSEGPETEIKTKFEFGIGIGIEIKRRDTSQTVIKIEIASESLGITVATANTTAALLGGDGATVTIAAVVALGKIATEIATGKEKIARRLEARHSAQSGSVAPRLVCSAY